VGCDADSRSEKSLVSRVRPRTEAKDAERRCRAGVLGAPDIGGSRRDVRKRSSAGSLIASGGEG
jgi:hypothetical protein